MAEVKIKLSWQEITALQKTFLKYRDIVDAETFTQMVLTPLIVMASTELLAIFQEAVYREVVRDGIARLFE